MALLHQAEVQVNDIMISLQPGRGEKRSRTQKKEQNGSLLVERGIRRTHALLKVALVIARQRLDLA